MALAEIGFYPRPQAEERLPLVGKEAVLKTLGYLGLHYSEYFVIGGANMVLRDIKKETTDLDMLVSQPAFDKLKKKRGAEIHEPPLRARMRGADNQTVWVRNSRTQLPVSATTFLGDGYYPMSFESHRLRTEIVEDVPCLDLDDVIASKRALQRPKDIADLQAIADFLDEPILLPPPAVRLTNLGIS